MIRQMLDVEAEYVSREMQDCLPHSLEELRERLDERRKKYAGAGEALEQYLWSLPERERAAVRCLIVRDLYHLFELYLAYLRSAFPSGPEAPEPVRGKRVKEEPLVPFCEGLFDPCDR